MSNRSTVLISKTINQIAIASITGVVFWVLFTVYDAVIKVPNVVVEPKLLEPINEELDGRALEEIARRKQLTTSLDTILIESPVATPSIDIIEEASPSGEVSNQ